MSRKNTVLVRCFFNVRETSTFRNDTSEDRRDWKCLPKKTLFKSFQLQHYFETKVSKTSNSYFQFYILEQVQQNYTLN